MLTVSNAKSADTVTGVTQPLKSWLADRTLAYDRDWACLPIEHGGAKPRFRRHLRRDNETGAMGALRDA
jgi:hypothetical protein